MDSTIKRIIFAGLLIFLTGLTRLLPHEANFTPVLGLAVFASCYIFNKKFAYLIPLTALLLSDIYLGFYSTMPFVYGAIILSMFLTQLLHKFRQNHYVTFGSAIMTALIFFIVSNFGHWLMTSMYTPNLAGLFECYVAAIPFFRATLVSTVITVAFLSFIYEISINKIPLLADSKL